MLASLGLPILLSFFLAVASGPLVLLIAPFLFGIGHMASTSKVLSFLWSEGESKLQEKARLALLMIFAFFGLFKLSPGRAVLYPNGVPLPEILLLAAFLAFLLVRRDRRQLKAGLPFFIALAGFLYSPVWSFAVLLFIHNLVAFIYWWRLAPSPASRSLALNGAAATVLVGAALASGLLDNLLLKIPQPPFISRLLVTSDATQSHWARTVMPFLNEPVVILRWVSIAAFGQLMHYYVWLRAIPKLRITNFDRKGFNGLAHAVFILTGLGVLLLAIYDPGRARITYIALAAAHGFAELGTLPLLFRDKRGMRDVLS